MNIKIQSNIVEQEIATPPQEYEAYLYRFRNLINDKSYVGIHKGSVDDSYRHSSTNKELITKSIISSNTSLPERKKGIDHTCQT